jgi:GDP-L-fucose synthase
MNHDSVIYVAGGTGMVGSAIVRRLRQAGYKHVLAPTRKELDLLDQATVQLWLNHHKPKYIFICAAKVGGIQVNNLLRADFIYENIQIECNIIHGAHLAGVDNLMFLGSSCIYPRDCPQPIKEDYLLTGPLEKTNEPYSIAKIAGIKLIESYNVQYGHKYVCVMPTNLYGPNDNYDLESSHVLPALIRKVHEAAVTGKHRVTVWGTGTPRREFLYVDDLADACVYLMEAGYAGPLLNIGTGEDIAIRDLAALVMTVIGFGGEIVFDTTKPDGTPRKLLDVSHLRALGWVASTPLREGIARAYAAAPFRLSGEVE